jgi:hypothetical protein
MILLLFKKLEVRTAMALADGAVQSAIFREVNPLDAADPSSGRMQTVQLTGESLG